MKRDSINELRWACPQCMAKLGRYLPTREANWIGAECNICRRHKIVTNVELYTAEELPWS